MKKINQSKSNGMWKGERAGIEAIHIWVAKRKPKPEKCPSCGSKNRLDLANISQKYKRSVSDFEWLCRKCHMTKDGRLDRLKKRNSLNRLSPIKCEICLTVFQPWSTKSRVCSRNCAGRKANRVRWNKI